MEFSLRVAHTNRMNFNKRRGNSKYNILTKMEGYELNIPHESQLDLYNVWVTDTGFFRTSDQLLQEQQWSEVLLRRGGGGI